METSPLARALRIVRGNVDPADALASAEVLARAGLSDRPKFAGGGYVTTDPGDAPPVRPWSQSDGGPFRPSPHDRPAPVPLGDAALAHALAVIGGQRAAFASGGPVALMPPHLGQALRIVGVGHFHNALAARGHFADGGEVPDPLKGRPHFDDGGSSGDGGNGGGNSSDSTGGYGGGYGGFGFGGGDVSSVSRGTESDNSGSYSGHASGFNSGSAAGSSTGGYGGFGGYSSSASVGGSYNGSGGNGSYSSSAVSGGGSSSANGGYGSIAGSLGQMGSTNSFGGTMSSGNASGNNGGFGGLSGGLGNSYSGASAANGGFGNFNSSNNGNGVGNTSSGGFGGFSSGAASGADSLSSALGTVGNAADGSYGGYRGAGTAYSGSQDGYGTNVAVAAANAPDAEQTAVAGPIAASGGFGNLTDNNPGFTGVGADLGVPGTASKKAEVGFGSFGDENTPSIGMFDSDLGRLGYGSFQTPAGASYANANSLAGQGVTPGIANTGEDAAKTAFNAGVNAGAAMESGMAGSGLTAANDALGTHVGALSPSIQAAMGSYTNPTMDSAAASAIPGATATRQAAATNWGNVVGGAPSTTAGTSVGAVGGVGGINGAPADAYSTSTAPAAVDGTHALTISRNMLPGMVSAAAIDGAKGTYDAPSAGTGIGVDLSGVQGAVSALAAGETDAYNAQHADLATKSQQMADGIDNAPSAFRGMVGGFLGAEPDAIKGWLSNPQAHPEVATAMNARLGQLQNEVNTGNVGGFLSTDRHGLDSMMSEGGFTNETDAINAARGFISGKMSDVAPSWGSVGAAPTFSSTGDPTVGEKYRGDAQQSPVSTYDGTAGSLPASLRAAAGLTSDTVGGFTGAGTPFGGIGAGSLSPATSLSSYLGGSTGGFVGGVGGYDPAATVTGPIGEAAATDIPGHPLDGTFSGNIPSLATTFSDLESSRGLPAGYLSKTAQAESAGNPDALNGTMAGEFQFSRPTAAQYGLTNPNDPVAAATAAANLAADNTAGLKSFLGRDPTGAETYAAHQQGLGGVKGLMSNPDATAASVVGMGAVVGNGGTADMSARDFLSHVEGQYNNAGGTATAATSRAGRNDSDAAGWSSGAASGAGFGNFSPSTTNAGWSVSAASGADTPSSSTYASTSTSNHPGTQAEADAEVDGAFDDVSEPTQSWGQKLAKLGINAGVAAIPGIGPIIGAGNLISGLTGHGTIGDTVVNNYEGGAQVGSPAMAGADHTSGVNGSAPLYTPNGGFIPGSGYGALDSSVTGSSAGVVPVDPNAAARTAMAAMQGGSTSSLSPSISAAANGNTVPGTPNAVTSSGVAFYDPMRDPVVLAALAKLRAA